MTSLITKDEIESTVVSSNNQSLVGCDLFNVDPVGKDDDVSMLHT